MLGNQGYSLNDLLVHVRSLRKSNKLSIAKSSAWLTACQGVISCLAPEEQMDVRTIDLDRALDVFRGRRPEFAGLPLYGHRSRITAAIASLTKEVESLDDVTIKELTARSGVVNTP